MQKLFILVSILFIFVGCDRQGEGTGSDVQFQQEHPGYGPGTGAPDDEAEAHHLRQ
jgi:hypothetical protein